MKKQLLIGCGFNREKRMVFENHPREWEELVTLDINPECDPDVEWDLNTLPYPFDDNEFDEIHAYEVLEHTGAQGDFRFFFKQFEEFWRILKPNGLLLGTSPALTSPWLWGDPGHTRAISLEALSFLNRNHYEQVGKTTSSDYRWVYNGDFRLLGNDVKGQIFCFVLQAIKPQELKTNDLA
jgi:hypothetical protein